MFEVPLSLRGIVAVSIALTLLMVLYIIMNSKEKEEYDRSTGSITYLDKELGQLPVRHAGKYRYLEIDGYQYPFEIFVGNESGDFKPEFDRIDDLKVGDTVTVYYYQTEDTKNEEINRFVQFIDKDGNSYFERGTSDRTLGVVVISLSTLLAVGGLVLWKIKKIPF